MKWKEKNASASSTNPHIIHLLQAGYRIEHDLSEPFRVKTQPERIWLEVRVYDGGVLIGNGSFEARNGQLWIKTETTVLAEYRRKGIGTGIYVYAEQVSGCCLFNDPMGRSEDAKRLWAQANRPFGKSKRPG
jgi:hypothetical protein